MNPWIVVGLALAYLLSSRGIPPLGIKGINAIEKEARNWVSWLSVLLLAPGVLMLYLLLGKGSYVLAAAGIGFFMLHWLVVYGLSRRFPKAADSP